MSRVCAGGLWIRACAKGFGHVFRVYAEGLLIRGCAQGLASAFRV